MENWYAGLDEHRRESLFATMRQLGTESMVYFDAAWKLSAPYGQIEIGGAAFDQQLKAAIIDAYLRQIRRGGTPDEALTYAGIERTEHVTRWNHKKAKDYIIQRSNEAEQALLECVHRRIIESVR